jgi:hypothetical protein
METLREQDTDMAGADGQASAALLLRVWETPVTCGSSTSPRPSGGVSQDVSKFGAQEAACVVERSDEVLLIRGLISRFDEVAQTR